MEHLADRQATRCFNMRYRQPRSPMGMGLGMANPYGMRESVWYAALHELWTSTVPACSRAGYQQQCRTCVRNRSLHTAATISSHSQYQQLWYDGRLIHSRTHITVRCVRSHSSSAATEWVSRWVDMEVTVRCRTRTSRSRWVITRTIFQVINSSTRR